MIPSEEFEAEDQRQRLVSHSGQHLREAALAT